MRCDETKSEKQSPLLSRFIFIFCRDDDDDDASIVPALAATVHSARLARSLARPPSNSEVIKGTHLPTQRQHTHTHTHRKLLIQIVVVVVNRQSLLN